MTKISTELQSPNLRPLLECCSYESAPFCSSWLQVEMQRWTELLTWTDPFSEDLTPRCVKLHPGASLHMPALAEKQRGVRTHNDTEGKGLPCSWLWGLDRVSQIQVEPVRSSGSPTEVQTRRAELSLTEEGSIILLDLTCMYILGSEWRKHLNSCPASCFSRLERDNLYWTCQIGSWEKNHPLRRLASKCHCPHQATSYLKHSCKAGA